LGKNLEKGKNVLVLEQGNPVGDRAKKIKIHQIQWAKRTYHSLLKGGVGSWGSACEGGCPLRNPSEEESGVKCRKKLGIIQTKTVGNFTGVC